MKDEKIKDMIKFKTEQLYEMNFSDDYNDTVSDLMRLVDML